MRKLTVAPNHRHLQWEDGEPFFYLGDTAWEIFHRLSREEVDHYMDVRAEQGFNVVQAVALAEFEGTGVPNAYGRLPLKSDADGLPDPTKPDLTGDYHYWDHVDYTVARAAERGLFIGLLPTWGDKINLCWGKGPVIFNEENARAYGHWIGARYKDAWNVIWIMGGDRPLEDSHRAIVTAMAEGVRAGDEGNHLISYHPNGESSSYAGVGKAGWLDFHMLQTGHHVGYYDCWRMIDEIAAADPDRPVLDGEPRYEDHPACFNVKYATLWDAADVRNSAYWDVFHGACGHTYGNHSIWSFNRERQDYWPYTWFEVLRHEGAEDMRHLKALLTLRPYFERRPAQELVAEDDGTVNGHIAGCRGEAYAFVYAPLGLPLKVNMGVLPGPAVKFGWFDPRTGAFLPQSVVPNHGVCRFVPPTQGRGQDWVLVLDSPDLDGK